MSCTPSEEMTLTLGVMVIFRPLSHSGRRAGWVHRRHVKAEMIVPTADNADSSTTTAV